MKATRAIATATATVFLAACTTVPQKANPDYTLVDPGRTDMVQYEIDYADCAWVANQSNVAANAAGGAAVGAVIGAVFGALLCGRACAGWGASGGAIGGATGGANAAVRDQQVTIRGCLTGRGYFVIR
jgi:outer membrane lipoprotein SlyB